MHLKPFSIASFVATALMSFTLTACGGAQTENADSTDDAPVAQQPGGGGTHGDPGQPVASSEAGSLNEWSENATWTRFNSQLELVWQNPGGDWIDREGMEQGSEPFSSADLIDDNQPGSVDIDVTSIIQTTGKAGFALRAIGGTNFVFHSRESNGKSPTLLLNGSITLYPAADTQLNSSTSRSLGDSATMGTNGLILIRFDLPQDVTISSATLRLESTGAEYGNQTLEVYATNSAIRTVHRPAWLQVDPTVIASFDANDVTRNDLPVVVNDDIATAQLAHPKLTWINSNKIIPNQTSACATVYQKLGADFQPGDGGKHPGFSNTGDTLSGSDIVNGISYPDSGWGGRSPDGIHWSARTGYGKWNDSHVAAHTYYYAMAPHNAYGWIDPIGFPFPKGEWTAYVQCLQLNTVGPTIGNNDGKLYYEISGVGPVYSRGDIRWRDIDAPQSEIREFWINYYCGGTSCGSIPNRGTISFSKAVITRGLPDMDAVAAEVARLNQTHP